MKFGFQIDPVHTLNHDTDSTLPMILESQKRKNRNFIFSPSSLTFKKNTVYALVKEIKFKNNKLNSYIISSEKILNLNSLNCIFIRQDPPYNMEYISSMHLLEQLNPKTKVINSPAGIRNAPEKILMLKFKDIIPPTLITRSRKEIDLFMSSCKRSVIKPLYGNGGQGIFLLDKNDKNYNQIIEKFIDEDSVPFIVQKFLPEIIKGDKRIILINGEPVAALKRIPKTNEFRSNIHVGGNTKAVKLSKNDRKICGIIKETLINEKLFFAGIDVIGNYLTEINVTSPTCIQEIKKLHKRLKTTIVYVTHDQTEAMSLGTNIAIMDQGKIQQCDTPKNIYNKPQNMFVADFIGSPSMNLLEGSLNNKIFKPNGSDNVQIPLEKYDFINTKKRGH